MGKANVLLVEDDVNLLGTLAEVLRDEDYKVVTAADAFEAIAAAAQARFDLIVTDVRLGKMDGVDCLVEIRRSQPWIRAIIVTGYASDDVPARAIRSRADDYIYKPFELIDLLLSVERVLDQATERESYRGILRKFVAGYKRLFSRNDENLGDPRHQAYTAFYVGVRSRKLRVDGAFNLWIKLETLEDRLDELPEGENLNREFQLIAREITEMDPAGPSTTPFEARLFESLHRNISSGKVSLEMLKQAYQLRRLDRETLENTAPLKEFYQGVWGS